MIESENNEKSTFKYRLLFAKLQKLLGVIKSNYFPRNIEK